MNNERIDTHAALKGLKDFQLRTIDYVFNRMYRDTTPARRFLVADEVGLGKTMVARGIIAKVVEHLQAKGIDRIDILYICSNATIAQQNLDRLNFTEQKTASFATRLTLLPTELESLKANGINFISFTPGTTFDLRSRGGRVEERVLIYHMLAGRFGIRKTPLFNLLQATIVKRDAWVWWIRKSNIKYDETLAEAFRNHIESDPTFIAELQAVCHEFRRAKRIHGGLTEKRYRIIGELRRRLADVCISALDPDLVILDEFQRFKDLLNGQDDAAELAQRLFRHPDVRVLLLSATPYRMLSLDHESEDDHYEDFLKTLGFLFDNDDQKIAEINSEFRQFRQALYGLNGDNGVEATRVRKSLENHLRSVIVRTERIDVTESRNAMVVEPPEPAPLMPADLKAARFIDRVAQSVGAGETIEYWKSSPYLVNFMGEYDLKRRLIECCEEPSPELYKAFREGSGELLRNANIQRYLEIDPANARLRQLLAKTVHAGQWQFLWLPPSLPYLKPGGAYAQDIPATKALIFSSWQVVPDAIAAICSYESERLMLQNEPDLPKYHDLHKKRRQLLQFRIDPQDKRPAGMPALALLYPCVTLARAIDPLDLVLAAGDGQPVDAGTVRTEARRRIGELLDKLENKHAATDGIADQRWYWAALALLDASLASEAVAWVRTETEGWLSTQAAEDGDAADGFRQHIELFIEALDGGLTLGRQPDDLPDVLADLALASPAICALRALSRIAPDLADSSPSMLSAASQVANGLRSLFNQPDATALLRAHDERIPYWRRVLAYGIDGNLQAVLDEFAHVLKENVGLAQRPGAEIATGVADAMREALSLRPSSLRVDDLKATPHGHIRLKEFSIRCRFALRFGDVRDDGGQTLVRSGSVRQAFNSPFRPFILASTSVGQEGLDFHPYCHVVYHWNLPSNPVDLEQREGRVHRYKGHAVRRNVSKAYGLNALIPDGWHDPWDKLFARAAEDRPAGMSELMPYWLFETEGGWSVERRVPLLPLSREVAKLQRLKQMLAVYRLAFGQPRQEDLLAYLHKAGASDAPDGENGIHRICLTPT
jgi:hypothetical protein